MKERFAMGKDSTSGRQRSHRLRCYRAVGVQPSAPLRFWKTHKHARAPGELAGSSRGQQEHQAAAS